LRDAAPDGAHRPQLFYSLCVDDDIIIVIDRKVKRASLAVIDNTLGSKTARTSATPALIGNLLVTAVLLQFLEITPCYLMGTKPQRIVCWKLVGGEYIAIPIDSQIVERDQFNQSGKLRCANRPANRDCC
jgi:hypothetical protein